VSLLVRMETMEEGQLPPVEYRWDTDTEILTAALRPTVMPDGLSGSMDIEGTDGAWLMLELRTRRSARYTSASARRGPRDRCGWAATCWSRSMRAPRSRGSGS